MRKEELIIGKVLTTLLTSLLLTLVLYGPFPALAATAPSLGDADSFAVLGASTVTSTGPTVVNGDLGVYAGSAVTGFPPGSVTGTIHAGDINAQLAQAANTAAFTTLDQVCTVTYTGTKDLVGENLVPGVYCAGAFRLTGTLTLSGSGVWIFKSSSDLITSGTANVVGGDPCNVWWRVVSSATLGTNTQLIGNILALTSINLQTGATLNGRALAQTGAVTMDSNTITPSICQTPTPNVIVTATPNVTVTATPNVTVTATPETRRVVEIIDNMSGVPLINESTINILAEDFMNFNAGNRYNITITSVTGGMVEFNKSGTLMGLAKETIKVDWTPKTQGAYILRSDANTTTEARVVQVINQKVISPVPELSTIALVSAGMLGLFGLAIRRRNS